MEDQILNEEDLIQKHRRERKELQAKIQSIKKTSDKKKKKEVQEQIARLEIELENKHQLELDQFKEQSTGMETNLNNLTLNEEHPIVEKNENKTSISPSTTSLRVQVSRAQRRRDKKAQQEKESRLRFSEKEDDNSMKLNELLKINEILKNENLMLHDIPSDGDCLFQSILHQLDINLKPLFTTQQLRKMTADYLRINKNEILPFMTSETGEIMSDTEFHEYCNNIELTKAWGSQIELKALSKILRSPIYVIQADGPIIKLGENYNSVPLIVTFHRYMYSLGEHYNSTKPFEELINDNSF